MSGIVFFRSRDIENLRTFYLNRVGCSLWLDQGGCILLRHGNFILGFCDYETSETEGCITFFYRDRESVDMMYERLKDIATTEPQENERYRIYNFFGRDPEGRTIEFQYFLHAVDHTFTSDDTVSE